MMLPADDHSSGYDVRCHNIIWHDVLRIWHHLLILWLLPNVQILVHLLGIVVLDLILQVIQ